jgi:excinuclease ABC subunit A
MYYGRMLRKFCEALGVDRHDTVSKLGKTAERILLEGTTTADESKYGLVFEGVIPNLHRRYENSESDFVKERLRAYMTNAPCPACEGRRLRTEALHVLLRSGRLTASIADVTAMTIQQAEGFFDDITLSDEKQHDRRTHPPRDQRAIGIPQFRRPGVPHARPHQFHALRRRGAAHPPGHAGRLRPGRRVLRARRTDHRPAPARQRPADRHAAAPHRHRQHRDRRRARRGHDPRRRLTSSTSARAPGLHGGMRRRRRAPSKTSAPRTRSITGAYLSGERGIPLPEERNAAPSPTRGPGPSRARGRTTSSHRRDSSRWAGCLRDRRERQRQEHAGQRDPAQGARKRLHKSRKPPARTRGSTVGANKIDRVIEVDQSPIGRTPRSNPATYTGVFDDIRKLFAQTKEARIRGYKPGRFSFNVKGGRCEACQGQGVKKIEMHFLPDVFVECEECGARRYNRETLEVRYRGKTDRRRARDDGRGGAIASSTAFPNQAECSGLSDVGLGLPPQLGQPSNTLSGGEAQRIKLASELGQAPRPATRCTCWTSRPPACTSPTSRSCSTCSIAWPTWATRGGHRAQPRRHQDRRLDHRPRSRKAATPAARWWPRAHPTTIAGSRTATPGGKTLVGPAWCLDLAAPPDDDPVNAS